MATYVFEISNASGPVDGIKWKISLYVERDVEKKQRRCFVYANDTTATSQAKGFKVFYEYLGS